jgi:adhesin HecA-like repeat protein
MARNGSGTYSKVNTFVAGNTITAAGFNQNWDDLASEMTNSVAADGQTTITAPLKFPNGTVSLPAHTFASDLDCGMYRIGANNIGLAVNGAKVVDVGTAGVTITGTFGSSGALTVTSGGLTVTAGGQIITAGGLTLSADTIIVPTGSNTAPTYSFASDSNTGAYRIGADNYGITAGGTKIVDVATTGVAVTGTLSASGTLTASNGFAVSSGTVTVPAASIANAAISTPPPVLLATLTASNSATLADTTSLTATYSRYRLVIENLVPANDATEIQLKYNVGGVQSTNYLSTRLIATEAAAVSGESTTHIKVSGNGTLDNTAANGGLCGELTIYSPSSTTFKKLTNGTTFHIDNTGAHMYAAIISGIWTGSNAAVTGIQIAADSGNLTSGTVKIYGLS